MQMLKRANGPATGVLDTAVGVTQAAGKLTAATAVYILAAAAATGIAAGYAGSKMTAHGKQDEETAKKEYENERLKADLGYLSARVKQEYQQFKNKQATKPARVLA